MRRIRIKSVGKGIRRARIWMGNHYDSLTKICCFAAFFLEVFWYVFFAQDEILTIVHLVEKNLEVFESLDFLPAFYLYYLLRYFSLTQTLIGFYYVGMKFEENEVTEEERTFCRDIGLWVGITFSCATVYLHHSGLQPLRCFL